MSCVHAKVVAIVVAILAALVYMNRPSQAGKYCQLRDLAVADMVRFGKQLEGCVDACTVLDSYKQKVTHDEYYVTLLTKLAKVGFEGLGKEERVVVRETLRGLDVLCHNGIDDLLRAAITDRTAADLIEDNSCAEEVHARLNPYSESISLAREKIEACAFGKKPPGCSKHAERDIRESYGCAVLLLERLPSKRPVVIANPVLQTQLELFRNSSILPMLDTCALVYSDVPLVVKVLSGLDTAAIIRDMSEC